MKDTKKKNRIIVIFVLLVSAVAVILGITIYNTPANRLARQLDLGEKYLAEQNYKQAIVEFDKAIAIDPMNERAYIGKAEAYVGMGDYEQAAATYATAVQTMPDGTKVWNAAEQFYLDYAQIYIDNGDYEKAISILEEGYDLLGSEKLHDKIGELVEEVGQKVEEERRASGIVDLPFDLRNITVNGYDLLEDHFAELRGLYPTGEGHEVEGSNDYVIQEDAADGSYSYYINNRTYTTGADGKTQELWVNSDWCYMIGYGSNSEDTLATEASLMLFTDYYNEGSDYEGLSVPIKPGSSYEDWCDVMQIAQIKENGSQPEWDGSRLNIPGEGEYHSFMYSVGDEDEYWVFMSDEYRVLYRENNYAGGVLCELQFCGPTTYSGEKPASYYSISVDVRTDGIIDRVEYDCFL